jgi:ribosomal protein S18 acetylase RimI-like enzyme
MKLIFRRAVAEDTIHVWTIADAISKKNKIANGASEKDLGDSGFLLYPLTVDKVDEPNYKERIVLGDHFWVAADSDNNSRIVSFMMAYTFHQYKQMIHLTDNDKGVLDFFVNHNGSNRPLYDADNIYIGQVGTHPDYARKGIVPKMMNEAFRDVHGVQAIGEIAQVPLRNKASSLTFERAGFIMPWTRPKDNGARMSGTFVRTFPWPEISR